MTIEHQYLRVKLLRRAFKQRAFWMNIGAVECVYVYGDTIMVLARG